MDKTEDTSPNPSRNKVKLPLVLRAKLLKESNSQYKAKDLKKQTHKKPIKKLASKAKDSSAGLDPTTLYLNEIGHTPLLSANEEVRLAREIAKGNDNSRKQMIESNLHLVVTLAKRAMNRGFHF
ncbi:MAG: sigma-70 factor domain-containing protein [Gammaproteobacteria bacterium]|jgi:DNA-directed RNA polymerase sigma subunit (sigma70/sigma32)|nr:sigma-70 factor domain-containing protein [Gammaproteobacteria bacterium]